MLLIPSVPGADDRLDSDIDFSNSSAVSGASKLCFSASVSFALATVGWFPVSSRKLLMFPGKIIGSFGGFL